LEYYLGCSGWSYDGWKGPFYPDGLDNKYWLSYYSQIWIRFVEEFRYILDPSFRHAIEIRHTSWFNELFITI
jgi:uncharacterized protein YecE (DUF72 family)